MQAEFHVRLDKLKNLREQGIDPYPSLAIRSATCIDTQTNFDVWSTEQRVLTLAGRLMSTRVHGGVMFADLRDETGSFQLVLKQDELGDELFIRFRDTIDPADIVEATGKVFLTKRGEKSLLVQAWRVLTKTLAPLPDKWHGLQDVELRYRKRYLDLLMDETVKRRLIARAKIISTIRAVLDGRGFVEVETPTLQPIYGGGFARPFKTHHHALDADFYLRISDEMYLKRLIVGGLEKVYEITKVFRNEGIDHDHNPEFTMFEAQIAYQNYLYGMDLFEELFEQSAQAAIGTTDIVHGDQTIHIARPWQRFSLVDAVHTIGGLDVNGWSSLNKAKNALSDRLTSQGKRDELHIMTSVGQVIALAFEELVEEKLMQPTIIYDYPVEVSPLAKKCSHDPRFVERFEAFALGSEIGNNYSELNDPLDLEQRFIDEKKKEVAGFDEAHQTDDEYLEAIRHGMPPTCGLGIGIDRMTMLLTGASNIKEVIAFPTLRPMVKRDAAMTT